MNTKKKTFAIYCSEGASRVIIFYSIYSNLDRYRPMKVIYDGERRSIINSLKNIFEDDLIVFNKYSQHFDSKRVHNSTSEFIQKVLDTHSANYLMCFGNKILKKKLINNYQKRLINFHPALLPSFKGLLSINQALDYGSSVLGNTAHFIDEGIDTGEIIVQTAMLLEDYDVYEDVLEMQFPMFKMILRDILDYKIEEEDLMKEIYKRNKPILIPKRCNLQLINRSQ